MDTLSTFQSTRNKNSVPILIPLIVNNTSERIIIFQSSIAQ